MKCNSKFSLVLFCSSNLQCLSEKSQSCYRTVALGSSSSGNNETSQSTLVMRHCQMQRDTKFPLATETWEDEMITK